MDWKKFLKKYWYWIIIVSIIAYFLYPKPCGEYSFWNKYKKICQCYGFMIESPTEDAGWSTCFGICGSCELTTTTTTTIPTTTITISLTTTTTIKSCIGEDESYDQLSLTNPKECCEGLTRSNVCDDRISIEDKCYEPALISVGCNRLGCSNCGDGICKENEDICSCPQDCIGKKDPDYATIEEFCNSEEYSSYCNEKEEYQVYCDLCA